MEAFQDTGHFGADRTRDDGIMALIAERHQNFVCDLTAFVFRGANLLWRLRTHRRSSNDHHKRGAQNEPEAFHVDAPLLRRLPAGLDTRTRQEQPGAAVIDPGGWVMRTCTVFLPARATRQSK